MEENNLAPMNQSPKQKTLLRSLLEVMLLVLTVIAAFQYAHYLIFPGMTIFYSHIIGITFGVMVIGATAYRVQKRQEQLSLEKIAETEKRMQFEASLLDVAEKYHKLFIDSMDGVCQTTLDGKIMEANQAFCDIIGCDADKIIGESIIQFYDNPEDRVKFRSVIEKNKGVKNYEIIQRRKDGQKIICSISSSCYYLKNGELSGYLSIVRDITDSKLQEEYREMGLEILQILNESRDLQDAIQLVLDVLKKGTGFDAVGIRLQDGDDFPYFAQKGFSKDFLLTENTLIERAADGGVCRDKDGNVSLECTCGLVILGKTDSANPLFTLGGSCWTNDSFLLLDIPPGEDPRVHPRNQCIHQGYASVALVPIRNKGRIVGLIQLNDRRKNRFTLDIVELLEGIAEHIGAALMRKRAEEAMRESEEKHRLLIENSHDIIYTLTPDGVFTFVSAAWTELLGHPVTQVAGQPFQPFVHPDDLAGCMAWLQKVIETGQRQEGVEYRVRHINGSWRWHTSSAVPLRDEAGTIIGFEGIARDITERRKAEEALQKALNDVKTLRGIVPICANCKKIRDDQGYWNQVEVYVRDHTEAEFSHSICPECMTKLYSGFGQDHGSAPENDGGAQ